MQVPLLTVREGAITGDEGVLGPENGHIKTVAIPDISLDGRRRDLVKTMYTLAQIALMDFGSAACIV